MDPMFQVLALFCSGTFFGVALGITLIQQPAAMDTGVANAARFFPGMYFKAAPVQVVLAMLGSVGGFMQWTLGAGIWWLIGTSLLFFVIPFTLLVIKPVNNKLLDDDNELDEEQTGVLLKRWGTLHALRTLFSGAAFLAFLLSPYL